MPAEGHRQRAFATAHHFAMESGARFMLSNSELVQNGFDYLLTDGQLARDVTFSVS